jgi:hypothetical protein
MYSYDYSRDRISKILGAKIDGDNVVISVELFQFFMRLHDDTIHQVAYEEAYAEGYQHASDGLPSIYDTYCEED